VRLDPNHPNLPAARRSFKRSILRQQAWRHFQAARTLADQGALAEAQQMLIEALSIDPASTQARLYQGELFEQSAEYSRAREAYLRILKDDPNNIAAARRIYKLPAPDGRSPPAVTGSTGDPFSITGLIPEDPPGTAYPASPAPDQITSLSNFVISLRNHTLGQDAHIQEAEARTRSLRDALARSITGRPAMRSPVSRKFLQPGSLESLLGGSAAVFVEAPPALPGMKETLIEGKASTGGSDPPVAPSRRRPCRQAVAPATIPPPGRPVLFELLRVHADRSSVRLQVALRNRGPTSISLPGSPTALVRSPGNPDRKVKIRFSGKVVPAGGNLTGTVRVPGNPLSPGATIVLTDLDPADFGSRRLYLTAAGQML